MQIMTGWGHEIHQQCGGFRRGSAWVVEHQYGWVGYWLWGDLRFRNWLVHLTSYMTKGWPRGICQCCQYCQEFSEATTAISYKWQFVKVASNKVSTKVKAISFAENGSYFVTAGNRWVVNTSNKSINVLKWLCWQACQVLVPGVLQELQVQGRGPPDGQVRHPRRAEEQLLLRCCVRPRRNGEQSLFQIIITAEDNGRRDAAWLWLSGDWSLIARLPLTRTLSH